MTSPNPPSSTAELFRTSSRSEHLHGGNPLRELTLVIDQVENGINLGQGVCDLDNPEPLTAGAVDSIQGKDRQTYTHWSGLPELKEQIAARLTKARGSMVDPEEVVVTAGASGAFAAVCLALLNPGDRVGLFEPFYSYHHSTLRMMGLQAVPIPMGSMSGGGGFALDLDAVESALPGMRMLVCNTPGNPSGKVFTEAELQSLGELLGGSSTLLLTDEVYEHMVFDGRRHIAPATIPSLAGRTITSSSFSKTYSMTGWRVGYLQGPRDVVAACGRCLDQLHVCAPRPMQRGVARALKELPDRFYSDLSADYQRRRDALCDGLERGGFRVVRPEGAYYAWADYTAVFGDVEPLVAVREMIERIGVNAVPGDLFKMTPGDVRAMRFHFAVEDRILVDAVDRLASLERRA